MKPFRPLLFVPLCCALAQLVACGAPSPVPGDDSAGGSGEDPAPRQPEAPFSEHGADLGLDFTHFNGMSGELYFVENMGQGAGLVDYDGDGDLDLYLVQGAMLGPGKTLADARPPAPAGPLVDRLYRNDLVVRPDGRRRFRFVDVTEESGLHAPHYGMGVAAGDYDNDGHTDLYLTNFGPNQLWRNRGDGTFEDVTAAAGAGLDDPRWSTCATFFDYDGDGWLDLFVCAYVDFRFELHVPCRSESGLADYCSPENYAPQPDRLFHNRGDGTFEDVTERAGLTQAFGGALGAVAVDFDRDGHPDLYVGNDQMPNQLWMNRGDGTFEDRSLLAGCAVNREGRAEATMGIDAADHDGDGDDDLFLTHLTWESNTLYSGEIRGGEALFTDRSFESGLGAPSLPYTGFGTRWLDYDGDTRPDLLVVNGAVKRIAEQVERGEVLPLLQPNQLFRNLGGGRYEEVGGAAGEPFRRAEASRGAAFGDVDNDGDTDVLVANNGGPARLLLNQLEAGAGDGAPWLGLRLVGRGGRDMLGARVTVELADGRALEHRGHADGSYLSTGDPRVLVALGRGGAARAVRVTWPGGGTELWRDLPAGTYTTLRPGTGEPATESGTGDSP